MRRYSTGSKLPSDVYVDTYVSTYVDTHQDRARQDVRCLEVLLHPSTVSRVRWSWTSVVTTKSHHPPVVTTLLLSPPCHTTLLLSPPSCCHHPPVWWCRAPYLSWPLAVSTLAGGSVLPPMLRALDSLKGSHCATWPAVYRWRLPCLGDACRVSVTPAVHRCRMPCLGDACRVSVTPAVYRWLCSSRVPLYPLHRHLSCFIFSIISASYFTSCMFASILLFMRQGIPSLVSFTKSRNREHLTTESDGPNAASFIYISCQYTWY